MSLAVAYMSLAGMGIALLAGLFWMVRNLVRRLRPTQGDRHDLVLPDWDTEA